MREGISIIHGARSPLESKAEARIWMDALACHFRNEGFKPVDSFTWSGGYLRSFGATVQRAYADHLLELWKNGSAWGKGCFRIHIFAKSNGAFIAERALRYLSCQGYKIAIGVLLQVATPDQRGWIDAPNVSRIVQISSKADKLYLRGVLISRLLLKEDSSLQSDNGIRVEHYETEDLSHHDFNYPRRIRLSTGFDGTTYELYARIFKGEL